MPVPETGSGRRSTAPWFTERLLAPFEDGTLVARGLGITNLCPRTSARAEELADDELQRGAHSLAAKVRQYRPAFVAVLGIGAYRTAFDRPHAILGLQAARIGSASVFVLPNPSGLNAHYGLPQLIARFAALRRMAQVARFSR